FAAFSRCAAAVVVAARGNRPAPVSQLVADELVLIDFVPLLPVAAARVDAGLGFVIPRVEIRVAAVIDDIGILIYGLQTFGDLTGMPGFPDLQGEHPDAGEPVFFVIISARGAVVAEGASAR